MRSKLALVLGGLGAVVLSGLTAACSTVQYFIANAPAAFGDYERRTNIRFGDDPRLRLDVYQPKATGSARPVVVFFYGGSWLRGERSQYRFVGAALAERGFVTVLPDYRLYPKARFPAFLDDGAQAVAWVQQHAHEFGGDPQRIVLMGHSAGAHLAAFLAFNHDYLQRAGGKPEGIAGLVGLSGPYVLRPNSRVLHRIFGKPYTIKDWQPVHFVDSTSPPTLLVHGEDDGVVSVEQTRELSAALKRHHVPVETEILAGRGHAATVAAFTLVLHSEAIVENTTRFIERVTSPSPSSSPQASRATSPSTSRIDPSPSPARM
jgi:acetyl esterase/lipase